MTNLPLLAAGVICGIVGVSALAVFVRRALGRVPVERSVVWGGVALTVAGVALVNGAIP